MVDNFHIRGINIKNKYIIHLTVGRNDRINTILNK